MVVVVADAAAMAARRRDNALLSVVAVSWP